MFMSRMLPRIRYRCRSSAVPGHRRERRVYPVARAETAIFSLLQLLLNWNSKQCAREMGCVAFE